MTLQTTKTVLLTSMLAVAVILSVTNQYVFADHNASTSTWQTDMTFDIHSSMYHVSHYSFTPATDFEDAADVWNNVSGS